MAAWLRSMTERIDFNGFRRIWQYPVTSEAEQGFLAACYEKVANRAVEEGEYYFAFDAAEHGLKCARAGGFPVNELTRLKATALARSGAGAAALRVVDDYFLVNPPEANLLSSKARCLRDAAIQENATGEKSALFLQAAECAAQARAMLTAAGRDWSYAGNQEAQFLFLAGRQKEAAKKAKRVIAFVEKRDDSDSMWNQTNLGEMHMVLGKFPVAETHYRRASKLGALMPGHLAANRYVASILAAKANVTFRKTIERTKVDLWFPSPVVIAFSGHMPDAKGRRPARLPESICRSDGPVAKALLEKLRELQPADSISCCAPGGDILFAEAVLRLGEANDSGVFRPRLRLLDPFPKARVLQYADSAGHDWGARTRRVFERADHSESITCAEGADTNSQCEYALQVMIGAAMLRASRINAQLQTIVLWDESDAKPELQKPGGTGRFVTLCRESGIRVHIINPKKLRK